MRLKKRNDEERYKTLVEFLLHEIVARISLKYNTHSSI